MSYIINAIWRYWKLGIALQRLKRARRRTLRVHFDLESERLYDKFRNLTLFKRLVYLCLSSVVQVENDAKKNNLKYHVMPYLNRTIGFLGGLILTTSTYFCAIYQLNFNEVTAMYLCIPLSFLMSFGLAFSKRCRCVMFLAAPQIFTDFNDILNTGKEKLNETVAKFKLAYRSMETLYNETWNDLDKQYGWLRDKQAICKRLKRRITFFIHDLTTRLFQSWVVMVLSPWLPLLIVKTAKKIIEEGFKRACDYDEDDSAFFLVKNIMRKRLDDIKLYVETEADFNISFVHHYSYSLNQSKSFEQVRNAILLEVKESFNWMTNVVQFLSVISSGLFLLIFIK